jgi:SAM-dependent methyltransferase
MGRSQPETYSFIRYLAAKKSVDDRALNQHVRQSLAQALSNINPPEKPVKVLEIGAGIGTMFERLVDWQLLNNVEYVGLDISDEHLAEARGRLLAFGSDRGYEVTQTSEGLILGKENQCIKVAFERADLFEFLREGQGRRSFDLLVAHAFLDLINLPFTLPQLFTLLRIGGLFYFTGNYDGTIIFEPMVDPVLDKLIETLYARTMDERITYGRISGESQSGRRVFSLLRQVGAVLLDSGSSDWVVFANDKGYQEDEVYFLHFVVNSVEQVLKGAPGLDPVQFTNWIQERHAQIRRGELVLVAHQLDFVGYWE